MNIWQTLGLDPTDDTSKIKKAYAQKLKIYHPEDDPEGFQKLKEAYDAAMQRAKLMKQNPVPKKVDSFSEDYFYNSDNDEDNDYNQNSNLNKNNTEQSDVEHFDYYQLDYDENTTEDDQDNYVETNIEFVQRMEELYKDFSKRINIDNWLQLINSPIVWNIGNKDLLNSDVLNFLGAHPNLPWEILRLLDEQFSLNSNFEYPNISYGHIPIKHILRVLSLKHGLSFKYLNEGKGYDVDEYLKLRQMAFLCIQIDKNKTAMEFVKKARKIYGGDLELLYIEGYCFTYFHLYAEALKCLNALLDSEPEHVMALHIRAKLHYEKEDYKLCLRDLLKLQELHSEFPDVPTLIAKSYLGLRDYSNSRIWLLEALEKSPLDILLKRQLLKCDEALNKLYNRKRFLKRLTEAEAVEHKKVQAELKLFQKQGLRSNPAMKKSVILSWVAAVLFFAFVLVSTLGSMNSTRTVPKEYQLPPPASSAFSYTDKLQVRLISSANNTYGFEDVSEFTLIKKLKLKHISFTDENSHIQISFAPIKGDENLKELEGIGAVYLAEYNSKLIILVANKGEEGISPAVTTSFGYIVPFTFSDANKVVNEALEATKVDTKNLIRTQYLTVIVPPSVYKTLPK